MKATRALLQFTTILPLGKSTDFEAFARHSYLYPISGYVVGGVAALIVLGIKVPAVAAAVALSTVLVVSGCNHFDGLLDFGDGIMAHGTMEKRRQALTDRQIGTGGMALGIIVTLLTFSGLLSSISIPFAILIAEVYGKTGMAILTVTGTPFREGLHSFLHKYARPWFPIAAVLLNAPLILLPVNPLLLLTAFLAMLVTAGGIQILAKRLFGGVNGDVVGASNEIIRMVVILVLSLAT